MGQSTSSDPLEEGSQPAAHWCRATELSAVMLSSGYCCCHAQKLGVCVHTVTVSVRLLKFPLCFSVWRPEFKKPSAARAECAPQRGNSENFNVPACKVNSGKQVGGTSVKTLKYECVKESHFCLQRLDRNMQRHSLFETHSLGFSS